MIQPLHRHDFYFVLLIDQGQGEHVIDFQSFDVQNKSLFFLRPGQVHQLTLTRGTSGYLLQFDRAFITQNSQAIKPLLRQVDQSACALLSNEAHAGLLELMIKMGAEYTSLQRHRDMAIGALVQLFLIELIRITGQAHPYQQTAASYEQQRLAEFLDLLQEHLPSAHQVNDYAEMMNLSPYQLNRMLKNTLQKTCSEAIREQLLLEAKRYLLATNNQIKDIARLLGFEDTSYFIRFFKKHAHLSPETFRTVNPPVTYSSLPICH